MTGQHRAPRPPSRAGRRAVAVAGSVALLTVAGTGTALACSPSESGSSGSSASSTQATNASYSGASSSASTSSSSSAKASRPDPKFGRFKDVNADDDVNVRGAAAVVSRANGNKSRVTAVVRGLDPDRKYVALQYNSPNCDINGEKPVSIIARYRVDSNGRGVAIANNAASTDNIMSVSVREQVGKSRALNSDDLVPRACARVR